MRNRSYDTTSTRVFCYPVILSRVFAAFNVDSIGERRALTGRAQIIKFTTFNNCNYAWDEDQKIWIPPAKEDQMREWNIAVFQKIKKTQNWYSSILFQPTDDESEDDGSYDPFIEDAPPTIPMDAFQAEMQAAFEQLHLTQDIHSAQLAKIMESSGHYANELAH